MAPVEDNKKFSVICENTNEEEDEDEDETSKQVDRVSI